MRTPRDVVLAVGGSTERRVVGAADGDVDVERLGKGRPGQERYGDLGEELRDLVAAVGRLRGVAGSRARDDQGVGRREAGLLAHLVAERRAHGSSRQVHHRARDLGVDVLHVVAAVVVGREADVVQHRFRHGPGSVPTTVAGVRRIRALAAEDVKRYAIAGAARGWAEGLADGIGIEQSFSGDRRVVLRP